MSYKQELTYCTLMHKYEKVADIAFGEDGVLCKIIEIYNNELMPTPTNNSSRVILLRAWWDNRCIPSSREFLSKIIQDFGYGAIPDALFLKSLGFNLSDQYWCKPTDNININYDDYNFFENDYSLKFGEALLSGTTKEEFEDEDFLTPDLHTNGHLPKQWIQKGGINYLKKTVNINENNLETYNEEIAYKIFELAGVDVVPYETIFENNRYFSVCPTLCNKDTEIVTAGQVLQQVRSKNESLYQFSLRCFKDFGFSEEEVVDYFNKLITLDYIIGNEDRHLENFGIIRDANTLETLGFAPFFDNGMCLYCDDIKMSTQNLGYGDPECKPFYKKWDKQLKLVTDLSWLDIDKLAEEVPKLLKKEYQFVISNGVRTEEAIDTLIRKVSNRIYNVQKLKEQLNPSLDDDLVIQ